MLRAVLQLLSDERVGPVAYLLGRFPTVSNTFVYREIAHLRDEGTAVQVYALSDSDDPDHAILDPREVRRVPSAHAVIRMRSPSRSLAQAWRGHGGREKDLRRAGWLAARWEREGVAVVHAHFLGTAAALAAAACTIAQIPLVVSVHARGILVPDQLSRFTLEHADAVRAISAHTSALVEARSGRTARVLPLAVEYASPAPEAAAPLHVLTVARPAAKKGYPVLREAMESLGTAARWTVVGATEDEIGGPMEGLSALGSVDFAALEAVYAEGVDVFALPCQVAPDGDEDGVPVAMLEAMARGVAVVTTPIGGIPEVIEDGVSGRLVPPRDPETLAGVLRTLRADPDQRRRLGTAGRAHVRQTRQPAVHARALSAFLQEVAHG